VKKDASILVASGQEKHECLWTRCHNRKLELKERRKRYVRQKYKYTGMSALELEKTCKTEID